MEKSKIIFVLVACLSFLYSGCVKDPQDIPPELTADPVFGLAGSFGTQSIAIAAGMNNWTAQPVVKEGESNLVYSSLFSLDGCLLNCSPSLEFRFYRGQPATNNTEDAFRQTIKTGPVPFVQSDLERDSFEITISTHPGLFMSGYSYWEDLNGPAATFLAEYESVIGFNEILNVCFQSLAFTGCQYSQCISFDPSTLVPCIAHIEAELENNSYVHLKVRPEKGTPPFQFQWADGSINSGIVLPLQGAESEVYADVKVTDALGNFTELKQTVRIQNGMVDACYFPISLISEPVNNASPYFAAGKAEIIYTDDLGDEWRSTGGVQPAQSSLTITDIAYFGLSPMDQATYKTQLNVIVELYNMTSGESRKLVLQNAVIPLSHP